MKALSIQQPWAWLIVNGPKDIENRDWDTSYRGLVLIHAGKQVDSSFFDGNSLFLAYAEQALGWDVAAVIPQSLTEYECGGIVGYATLTQVVTKSKSRWFRGKYGFVLTQRHPVDFIPLRGRLGLFDVPAEIEAHINEIRNQRVWEADMKDMAQIKREWREYAHKGDETPPTPPSMLGR